MTPQSGNSIPLLFVENREKTRFWAEVATVLQARGFSIHWIVQNHAFGKNLPGTVHKLPYPKRKELSQDDCVARYPVLVTDRGRQYFKAGSGHYPHYASEIRRIFEEVQPALVIGESTLFHELLAVSIAEDMEIPFIHPAAERYPQDRFVMFSGTSQEAFVSSDDFLSREDARAFARRVCEGTERPVYMQRPSGFQKIAKRARWFWTRGIVWLARLQGERYNTPSLIEKWRLSRWSDRNRAEWARLQREVPAETAAIMYPMHVAPEANIDVWGRPYEDQVALIRRLLAACPDTVSIAVKANPYPKYEIKNDLIELARSEPRLILLPLAMPMAVAMTQCLGAITVSGTVAFEAIFGKGRCLALRHPIIDQACPGFAASSPEEAVVRLLGDAQCGIGNDEAGIALLQAITARSYRGLISDPFSNIACIEPENTELVATGIAAAASYAVSAAADVPKEKAA